jgi:hypothetical protein
MNAPLLILYWPYFLDQRELPHKTPPPSHLKNS